MAKFKADFTQKDDDLKQIESLDRSLSDGQRTMLQCSGMGSPSELVTRLLEDARAGEIREAAEHDCDDPSHCSDHETNDGGSGLDELLQITADLSNPEAGEYVSVVKEADGFSIRPGNKYDRSKFIESLSEALKGLDEEDPNVLSNLKTVIADFFKIALPDTPASTKDIIDCIPAESTFLGDLNFIPSVATCSIASIVEGGIVRSEFDKDSMSFVDREDNVDTPDGSSYSLPDETVPPMDDKELEKILESGKDNLTDDKEDDTDE